jgi:hypothetical protein
MKPFRQLCITVVLVLSLSSAVLAGELPCGIVNPPPTPPPGQAANALDNSPSAMAEFVISIIQSILPTF